MLDSVGEKAAFLPGGVRKLGEWHDYTSLRTAVDFLSCVSGECLKEMVASGREINHFYANWVSSQFYVRLI